MSSVQPPGFRFGELQQLLNGYTRFGATFTDTPEAPGPALAAFLRIAAGEPRRASDVTREIDDLLQVGLFSDEIADDVDLMPRIQPRQGLSVEDSFRIIRGHLHQFIENPSPRPTDPPQSGWEWVERFPELNQFIGGYFHQDFLLEYSSFDEATADYLSTATDDVLNQLLDEIRELLSLPCSDTDLKAATEAFGMGVRPPGGQTFRQWINAVGTTVTSRIQP